jgi:predicted nucleic acid-binding protein
VIHLDTSFLIRALARGSPEDRRLRAWLQEATTIGISAVSWAEFLCGPVEAEDIALAARIVGDPVEFTADDSAGTARLFNLAGRRRGSFTDCMIAAVALRVGASMATTNPDDFGRFAATGLEIATA